MFKFGDKVHLCNALVRVERNGVSHWRQGDTKKYEYPQPNSEPIPFESQRYVNTLDIPITMYPLLKTCSLERYEGTNKLLRYVRVAVSFNGIFLHTVTKEEGLKEGAHFRGGPYEEYEDGFFHAYRRIECCVIAVAERRLPFLAIKEDLLRGWMWEGRTNETSQSQHA